jgi:MOSC domain-containing protein YiiM
MIYLGPYEFSDTDAHRTFALLGDLWDHMIHDIAEVPLAACGEALAVAEALNLMTELPGIEAPNGHQDPLDPQALSERLRTAGEQASAHWKAGGWDLASATAALETAWVGLRGLSVHMRNDGLFGAERTGHVTQINVSGGGVPKLPVDAVAVDYSGIIGDTQASRQHHGRPWQALSLWSAEVIEALQAEGHPILPGSAGENLTISGVEWSGIRPGMLLQIGEVFCEVSCYTMPCTKIAGAFHDREQARIDYRRGPASRLYATVVVPGRIATGDPVIVEPTSAVS